MGVLRELGCSHPLQANQIQGGDYNAVFPVVQWVVRLVLQHRRLAGDAVRKASEAHFGRRLGAGLERASLTATAAGGDGGAAESLRSLGASLTSFAGEVEDRYAPRRRYRRSEDLWASGARMDPLARVQACLLEYGETFALGTLVGAGGGDDEAAAGDGSDMDRKMRAMQKAAKEAEAKRAEEAAAREERMLGQMSAAGGGKVKGQAVRQLVGMGGDGIARSRDALLLAQEQLRAEAESGELLANSRVGKAQAHKRRVGKARKAADKAELRAALAEEELEASREELGRAAAETAALEGRLAAATAAMAALAERAEAAGKTEEWLTIRRLMATSAMLALQEKEFKRTCKRQLASLQARIQALEAEEAADGAEASGPVARLRAAEAAHAEVSTKHKRFRGLLARRNHEIARLRRVLDDVPSRGELLQYEKRFVELFEELNATREETDKRFASYNFQNEERKILEQETTLIGSVHSSFATAMKSSKGQAQFLEQMDKFVGSARGLGERQREQLAKRQRQRDAKAAEHDGMADKQRAYFRAVKQLQQQAERNEALAASVEAAGIEIPEEAEAEGAPADE